jgi:hypothetical protein
LILVFVWCFGVLVPLRLCIWRTMPHAFSFPVKYEYHSNSAGPGVTQIQFSVPGDEVAFATVFGSCDRTGKQWVESTSG